MQRPAQALRLALRVERIGDGERIGIELDHAVQRRTVAVDGIDPRQVLLGDRAAPYGVPIADR